MYFVFTKSVFFRILDIFISSIDPRCSLLATIQEDTCR